MYAQIIKLLLTGLFGAFVFTSPKVIRPVIISPAIRVWTAKDLRRIASDDTILAVLATVRLKIAMAKNSSTKDAIDSASLRDIGDALVTRFGWKANVLDDVVSFAKTKNATATCSAPGSAGVGGLDECVSRCERRSLGSIGGKKPHGDGCYALCSLAVAPCHARPFTWTAWFRAAERETRGLLDASVYVLLAVSLATGHMTEFCRRLLRGLHEMTPSQAVLWFAWTYILDSRRVTLLLFWAIVLSFKYAVEFCSPRTFQTRLHVVLGELERRRTSNESGNVPGAKVHIRATWEESSSSSSSSSSSEEEDEGMEDDEIPPHIRATWGKSASSSSSSAEEDSSDDEMAEDHGKQGVAASPRLNLTSLASEPWTDKSGIRLKTVVMQATKQSLKKGFKGAEREIRILASLTQFSHENIIFGVFGTSFVDNTMVMEAMFCNLYCLIKNDELSRKTSHSQMIGLCRGGAMGLQFLHEKGIVHGDVKLNKFLVSEDRRLCKVTDSGSAGPRNSPLTSKFPNFSYAAPEAFAGKGAEVAMQDAIDVWSMAIVVLQAVFREARGPMADEVLSTNHELLLPPPVHQCLAIAHRNYDILCDRADSTGLGADENARCIAKSELEAMRDIYPSMLARLKSLDEYLLSRRVWRGMADLAHEAEVRKVLASMLDPDPRKRVCMGTVASALSWPRLWRMEGDDEGEIVDGTFGSKVMDLFSAIDEELAEKMTDEPSWLAVAEAAGKDWWTRMPVPKRVA